MSSRDIIFPLLLAFGFFLQAIPLPDMITEFGIGWVLLLCIAWQLSTHTSLSFIVVVVVGLLLDVQKGTLLGAHVASLSLCLYIVESQHKRFAIFALVQQMGVIFALVILHQLIIYLLTSAVSERVFDISIWQPALISALVWPWLNVLVLSRFQHIR